MASDWHPEDIKAGLRKRYGTIGRAATAWGYTRASISRVLRMAGCSAPVELKIAEALGKPPQEIWPSRWTVQGYPVRLVAGGRRSPKPAAPAARKHRENGAVA